MGASTTTPEAMRETLSRNWWALALRGALAILFGVAALLLPVAAMLSAALFFGAYLLADGVLGVVSAARAGRAGAQWGWLLAEGIVTVLMGVLALLFPAGAVLGFVLAVAAWAFVSGGMMVAASFRLRAGKGWMLLGGAVSLLWGLLLVAAPLLGALVVTWWIAAYAFAFGVAMLVLAFRLRRVSPAAG